VIDHDNAKIAISPNELPLDWRDLPIRLSRAEDELKLLRIENERLRDGVIARIITAIQNIPPQSPAQDEKWGAPVLKTGSGYNGPGTVITTFRNTQGAMRYVVGHTIQDGDGEFYHIYSEKELQWV
jgi:hypothetical protein